MNRKGRSAQICGFTLATLLAAAGCNFQNVNSFSGDAANYGVQNPTLAVKDNFRSVQLIIKTNCASCHAYGNYSEKDWVSNQLVVAGDPAASLLFQRLRGSGVAGAQNMPQGGQLSNADISTIKTWIAELSTTSTGGTVPSQPIPVPPPTPTLPEPIKISAQARTTSALSVLQTNCASCHGGPLSADSDQFKNKKVPAFANFTSDGEFIVSGLVKSGSIQDSWLYRSLRSYGDLNRMPLGGEAIDPASREILEAWITKMAEP